jgi:signal transduction histidine kinase
LGLRSFANIPLLHQGQSLGFIILFSRRLHTSITEDLALLSSIGHQVATAVTNARLFRTVASQRSRLQTLIESSRDGIVLVGMDLRLLLTNAPALKLLGLPGQPESWTNRPILDALEVLRHRAPTAVRMVGAETRRVQQGDEPPGEGELEIPPHTLHWLNLPVLAGGAPQGRLIVLRDVTEERRLEKTREDLTDTMVHDLRSPLTAIFAALDMLSDPGGDELSDSQCQLVNIAVERTEKMLRLVNNILDVSRLESGQMDLRRTPVSLTELVDETLRAQFPLAADKGIRLDCETTPGFSTVCADAELIERVLQNLVDNAIKFTPSGGSVQIVMGQSNEECESPQFYVSVQDSGPGIPPDLQDRLFQKFVSGRQQGSGSGLGLAFCRLAIEAHGGHIWSESMPGKGTIVTFTLPAADNGAIGAIGR